MRDLLISYCGTDHPLLLKLHGGNVRRYHQTGLGVTQSVAEHTWRLLIILLHICPDASEKLIRTAIYHDVPEGFLGDIAAPTKRHPLLAEALDSMEAEFVALLELPSEKALSATDYARLKCADYLELCMFCKDVGTRRARQVYTIGLGYVSTAAESLNEDERLRILSVLNLMEGS
jgi:hypothetical protein